MDRMFIPSVSVAFSAAYSPTHAVTIVFAPTLTACVANALRIEDSSCRNRPHDIRHPFRHQQISCPDRLLPVQKHFGKVGAGGDERTGFFGFSEVARKLERILINDRHLPLPDGQPSGLQQFQRIGGEGHHAAGELHAVFRVGSAQNLCIGRVGGNNGFVAVQHRRTRLHLRFRFLECADEVIHLRT